MLMRHTEARSRDLEYYAIRLESEQSLSLFGYFAAKKTLTWHDIQCSPNITLGLCIASGIPCDKLYKMQPDIKEWIRLGRANVNDCMHMTPW